MDLKTYNRKRDFSKTAEPEGEIAHSPAGNRYLIQKHAASHLHYDFRLEIDGVLKSWSVPKGPSLNPSDKRLAVMTEDHPIAYGDFEGTIPAGEYGGGTVMLWDTGTWEPEGDAERDYKKGRLDFTLQGERLHGSWHLTRMRPKKGDKREYWLLIKGKDNYANANGEKLINEYTTSVITQRKMQEIATADQTPDREYSFTPGAKAIKTTMPDFISPQLATLENDAPTGKEWLHEIKYDGYRLQLHKDKNHVRCLTRRGHDWSHRFSHLCEVMRGLPAEQAIIDGEVVVLDAQGISDFKALQNALEAGREQPVHFYGFDLLYYNGYDLRKLPLTERKKLLADMIIRTQKQEYILYSDHIIGRGDSVYANSCMLALEGIISKKATSVYHSGRNRDWLKSKCSKRQEFVVGGFQEPSNRLRGIGALLLGYYEGKSLCYAGKVGTGFSNRSGSELRALLEKSLRKTSPFSGSLPSGARKNSIWVEPKRVVEVEFTEWTQAGALRHPSFVGLREDKQAQDVIREQPDDNVDVISAPSPLPDIRLTSPDKVLWPSQNLTKRDLADYYHHMAAHMLPYVVNRPLSLVRCPEGRKKSCFFQRHQGKGFPPEIGTVTITEDNGQKMQYLTIQDEAGLLSLAQVGALEIHPWGARNDDTDAPDTLIFDMDPAEDVPLEQVKQAARDAKERLDAIGLQSFLKTTGGKGLHVVVPLERRQNWETLKGFARGFAKAMASDAPDSYIATSSKAKRKGKVFVDYLRNQKSATAIAPFSTRARENAPVAVPLPWDELDSLPSPSFCTVATLPQHFAGLKNDPWADYHTIRQSITRTMAKKYPA